jgi:L-arabinose 1- dehydrogenase
MYNFVIIGYGEIASKAHTPAIEQRVDCCTIKAIVDIDPTMASSRLSKYSKQKSITCFTSLSSALQRHPDITAASICTPQSVTMDYAYETVSLGLHTLLEKPPGDYTRLPGLLEMAKQKKVTVFTAYHSTVPPGITYIQEWIQQNRSSITKINIEWKENVRKWHPNQQWVTTREGMGVLDILFNPLSLLVYVLPHGPPQFVSANLTRPSNWQSPISGRVYMLSSASPGQKPISIQAEFAWDYEPSITTTDPEEIWNIAFEATRTISPEMSSTIVIKDGGAQVYIDNNRVTTQPTAEYRIGPEYVHLYSRFVNLIQRGESYVDGTTPYLINEILEKGDWSVTREYNI